jgi:thymidylate synthase ThyX
MIQAKIITDSINQSGERLTTFLLTYPRFIHSEFMTHRLFSRNAASSRAIPIEKMIKAIEDTPAMPIHWGKIQKGMQAKEEVDDETKKQAQSLWLSAMKSAVAHSKTMGILGVHKQIANRITEPYSHMMTLVTATEYENFFSLRAHKDAQPEIQALAYEMLEKYNSSTPTLRRMYEWHLPFGDELDEEIFNTTLTNHPELTPEKLKLKIATARCARTSYTTLDTQQKHNYEGDIILHDKLLEDGHFSPFEHCAEPRMHHWPDRWSANFKGWTQYRKSLIGENKQDSRVIKK